MKQHNYRKTISNDYLGIVEELAGSSPVETELRAQILLAGWQTLEKQARKRAEIEDLWELAEFDTGQAQDYQEKCSGILLSNLEAGGKLEWTSLYRDQPFPPFVFKEPAPRYELIAREMGVPRKKFLAELFFPSVKERRLKGEKEARQALDQQLRDYDERMEAARAAHEKQRRDYLEEQLEHNEAVDRLQVDFERGEPYAVESFARIALARLKYPGQLKIHWDACYHQPEKMLVINCLFPGPGEVPRVLSFKHIEGEQDLVAKEMGRDEFDQFYQSVLLQLTLSSLHTVFQSLSPRLMQRAGFNGLVKEYSSDSEERKNFCILSVKAERDTFAALDLAGTSPGECFYKLGGVLKEPLTRLSPVKPLVDTNRPALPSPAGQEAPDKPEVYQPGEIKRLARVLVTDLVNQIEDNLTGSRPKKTDLH